MSKRLADKVAVVTGASKGIGAAIAKQLASEGASVVVNYSSSKEGADVVAEIKKEGGKAVAVQADVAKKADVERLFAESKKAFGKARYSRQQRRNLRICPGLGNYPRQLSQAIRSQRPRPDLRFTGSSQEFRA